jgi:DNA polymerase III subunit beta
MKITMPTKSLGACLKAALPAVATRPPLPILSGVRLGVSEDGLNVEATDLELTVRRAMPEVAVAAPGIVVVPAKSLAKTIASAGDQDVELESTDEGRPRLDVRAGARTVTLPGYAAEDWPAIPRVAEITSVARLEAHATADAFARAALCSSADESRPVLTAVSLFFDEPGTCVEVVATDSYRLGAIRIPLTSSPRGSQRPLLVPARAARIVARQLKKAEGQLEIGTVGGSADGSDADHVALAVSEASWMVRTIAGEFPNWRQVVPEAGGALLEFDAEELTSAVRAATSVGSRTAGPVRLELDGACSLSFSEPDQVEMRQALAGAKVSPNGTGAVQVAFNPGYLADAIAFCGAECGRMWVRDALKPVLFEGPDRRYALMPVRTP